VGELVAFIAFFSLSISVFLESIKHIIDVIFVIPKQESNSTILFTAHGHGKLFFFLLSFTGKIFCRTYS
jgi:hypothetical protein